MSCYTYNIILKLFISGCLAIVRKRTKLIEGGHRGLHMFTSTFLTSKSQKSWLLRFLPCFIRFLELLLEIATIA